jgi:hypothetical protein
MDFQSRRDGISVTQCHPTRPQSPEGTTLLPKLRPFGTLRAGGMTLRLP